MRQKELQKIERMKQLLRQSVAGRGIAGAMVEVFSRADAEERDAARRILLGTPPQNAVLGANRGGSESDELLRYVVAEAKVDVSQASRRAERLARLFERWAEMKQAKRAEDTVLRARGHMVCAILGAVMALLSSLAPVMASFQISLIGQAPVVPPSSTFVLAGAGFTLVSSAFLGTYLSPRSGKVDPLIAFVAYAAVAVMVAPLTSFSLVQ